MTTPSGAPATVPSAPKPPAMRPVPMSVKTPEPFCFPGRPFTNVLFEKGASLFAFFAAALARLETMRVPCLLYLRSA